jgi:hypothetical protein
MNKKQAWRVAKEKDGSSSSKSRSSLQNALTERMLAILIQNFADGRSPLFFAREAVYSTLPL